MSLHDDSLLNLLLIKISSSCLVAGNLHNISFSLAGATHLDVSTIVMIQ